MIKLRFIPSNDISKNYLVSIGKKHFLDLSLKPTKSWRSVQEHLCKKWADIPDLVNRLTLYPCLPAGVPPFPLVNFLSDLSHTVAQSLQQYPQYQLNPTEDGQIIPVYYQISAPSSSSLPSSSTMGFMKPNNNNAIISEDSLIKAIDTWNEHSVDSYLIKEKAANRSTNIPPVPVAVFPPLPPTMSKLETLSTIAASAATLLENGHSNFSNLDQIMNSNTMHGLIQDLMSEQSNPPLPPPPSSTHTSHPPAPPTTTTLSSQPAKKEDQPLAPSTPTKNQGKEKSKGKKNNGSSETSETLETGKKKKTKRKTPTKNNAKQQPPATPTTPTRPSLSLSPPLSSLLTPNTNSVLKPSEFTNLINSYANDDTNSNTNPTTTNNTTNTPSNVTDPSPQKTTANEGKPTNTTSNNNNKASDVAGLFINHENSLYIKDVYAEEDNYSKSNLSLSQSSFNNRNFAHIFMMSEKSKEAKKPEEKAMNLLNSLATSHSLYQSIVHSTSSAALAPPPVHTPPPPLSAQASNNGVSATEKKGSGTPLGAVFGAASPATVVTPISDAEASNMGKVNTNTTQPCTPQKPSHHPTNSSSLIAISNASLNYGVNNNGQYGSPQITNNASTLAVPKTPASTKKRKLNGLEQKRQELLNETNNDNGGTHSHHEREEGGMGKSTMLPTSPQDLFSPMKAPRTMVANTPSKTLLMKDISDKAQLAVEQHVLTANIMSGVCHLPAGFSAPAKKVPSFIQQLSRKGRSRPELRRITPTYIGPLMQREGERIDDDTSTTFQR